MLKKILLFTAIAALAMAGSARADGITLGFVRLTNNGNANVASQLTVQVAAVGTNQVSFTFFNAVGIASSITDIYFDDGTLLGLSGVTSSAGVNFNTPAVPGNLPGGNTAAPPFETTAGWSADSDSPVAPNGVNAAGEWVTITFNLINGKNINDTIAALGNGDLRIGLHVQAIGATNGSDSYINTPGTSVPDGGMTISLLGLALAGLGLVSRRRN
jgi:hypothetical protein